MRNKPKSAMGRKAGKLQQGVATKFACGPEVVLGVGFTGFWRRVIADEARRQTQVGEGATAAAAREVAQVLKAQPAQVDGDTVVAGKYGRNPATGRLSPNPEKPPPLIQLQVPLLPWLAGPRESVVKERGAIMATGNRGAGCALRHLAWWPPPGGGWSARPLDTHFLPAYRCSGGRLATFPPASLISLRPIAARAHGYPGSASGLQLCQ